MGSDSDLPTMAAAAEMLEKFGISFEVGETSFLAEEARCFAIPGTPTLGHDCATASLCSRHVCTYISSSALVLLPADRGLGPSHTGPARSLRANSRGSRSLLYHCWGWRRGPSPRHGGTRVQRGVDGLGAGRGETDELNVTHPTMTFFILSPLTLGGRYDTTACHWGACEDECLEWR